MSFRLILALFLAGLLVTAADYRGVVKFGGLPIPGASVTATRGSRKATTITDANGFYSFAGLEGEGAWTIRVEMQLFAPEQREAAAAPMEWELKLLPPEQLSKVAAPAPAQSAANAPAFQRTEVAVAKDKKKANEPAASAGDSAPPDPAAVANLAARAADGFLINGSVNNGASSPFAQFPAFGNNRRGQRSLYNGNLGLILNNSALDARSYSLTGQDTPKPDYSRLQGLFSFGGPIKIPRLLMRNGPMFSVNYQWTRNRNASVQSVLVPTLEQREGRLGDRVIPASLISPQARALLDLYPLPNFSGSSRYNFQVPIVTGLHQDDLQVRVNKQVRRNAFSGGFALQSTRTDTPDIFGFLETGNVKGINAEARYRRSFSPRMMVNAGYQFSRLTTRVTPYFSNLRNVSGEAGIQGNNQEPVNWGPPSLEFSSGIAPLTMSQASLLRNQTSAVSVDAFMNRARHNLTYGAVHRRQQFNVLSQQDARGTFAFTGAATGNDFGGFLLGVPDTSTIAFGNPDKYLRATVTEGFLVDDYRVNPSLTINAGVRWEYWSPVHEKYGRLVNLDIAPGFQSVTPSLALLPRPDRNNFAPRVAFSWRPLPASSMVVRSGYGIYYDTSVYQPIAMQMAQQAPLSKSLRVSNSRETPLTLANGFYSTGDTSPTTFAVDPEFRIGYSQNWQLSVQRDLPGALQMSATYSGNKGTRNQQQILPNTFPGGSIQPAGYTYLMSNGNAIRHAGQFQLRRRLRSGFTASTSYTYAKSIDNASLGGKNQGGGFTAQNWLDLRAERGRSNFDQRHLLTGTVMYTTGMGIKGGGLATGKLAKLLKEWALGSQFNIGTGLPLTPVYFVPVRGTGVTGSLRPDYTGADVYDAPSGLYLNPAAYTASPAGQWGNAGRNSITGPRQFTVSASLGRSFRSTERVGFDFRLDAANAINTVTFPRWNTVAGNAQFGLPTTANPMRTIQATLRTRF